MTRRWLAQAAAPPPAAAARAWAGPPRRHAPPPPIQRRLRPPARWPDWLLAAAVPASWLQLPERQLVPVHRPGPAQPSARRWAARAARPAHPRGGCSGHLRPGRGQSGPRPRRLSWRGSVSWRWTRSDRRRRGAPCTTS